MVVYEIRLFNGTSYLFDKVSDFEHQKSKLALAGISFTCFGRAQKVGV